MITIRQLLILVVVLIVLVMVNRALDSIQKTNQEEAELFEFYEVN